MPRPSPKLAALLIAVLALVLVGWWLWTSRERQTVAAAQANTGKVTAQEETATVVDTQRVVVDVIQRDHTIDTQTRENRDAIIRSEGAGDRLPPAVSAAGWRALCLRAAYRHDPACLSLLGPVTK